MLRTVIAAIAVATLAGCAQVPDLTREQQLAATTRQYKSLDKERVIDAARRVLQLADGDRIKFADNTDGFIATHQTALFMLVGARIRTDTWTFSVRDTPSGLLASAALGRMEQATMIQPTTSPGVFTAGTTPVIGTPIPGNAVYDLFWRRLEYMLHRTNTWTTCKESDEMVSRGLLVGSNDSLCSIDLADFAPNEDLTKRPIPGAPPGQAWPRQQTRALDRAPQP